MPTGVRAPSRAAATRGQTASRTILAACNRVLASSHLDMVEAVDHEAQATSRPLARLVDRLIPPELHADIDAQLRSRVLVGASFGLGVLILVAVIVRLATFPFERGVLVGMSVLVVALILPLVQWISRSHRIAGGLMVVVWVLGLLAMNLLRGVFPDATMALFAVVPMIAAFFVGPRWGYASAWFLAVATLGLQAVLVAPQEVQVREFWWSYVVITAVAPLMGAVLAAAYERARARTQGRLAASNRALVEASARADAANRGKTDFLRHVSHELRTPLNAILGYGELVREQLAHERHPAAADVEKLCSASVQLLGLINELLDISRVEAGAVEIRCAEVDPLAVLAQVRDTALPLAAMHHNTLTIAAADRLPTLLTDEQRLRQILLNLVGNACKFTDGGTVAVFAEVAADAMRFRVRDSGVGLTAEQCRVIFEPFVQVHALAERRGQGSGLGLTLSRKLAVRLGGDITVVSEPGAGAEFTLQLPLRPVEPGAAP